MKYLANEIFEIVEASSKDQTDLEKLFCRISDGVKTARNDHPAIAGSIEGALALTSIAIGVSLVNPVDCVGKIPELLGAVLGAGAGGGVVGTAAYLVGGIGVAMMGTAFSIPAATITAIGIGVGALSGSAFGWFGVDLATQAPSLLELLFDNISGAALIAFGCYMLCLSMKDLWRAGGEFITYLKNLGVNEILMEELS